MALLKSKSTRMTSYGHKVVHQVWVTSWKAPVILETSPSFSGLQNITKNQRLQPVLQWQLYPTMVWLLAPRLELSLKVETLTPTMLVLGVKCSYLTRCFQSELSLDAGWWCQWCQWQRWCQCDRLQWQCRPSSGGWMDFGDRAFNQVEAAVVLMVEPVVSHNLPYDVHPVLCVWTEVGKALPESQAESILWMGLLEVQVSLLFSRVSPVLLLRSIRGFPRLMSSLLRWWCMRLKLALLMWMSAVVAWMALSTDNVKAQSQSKRD